MFISPQNIDFANPECKSSPFTTNLEGDSIHSLSQPLLRAGIPSSSTAEETCWRQASQKIQSTSSVMPTTLRYPLNAGASLLLPHEQHRYFMPEHCNTSEEFEFLLNLEEQQENSLHRESEHSKFLSEKQELLEESLECY